MDYEEVDSKRGGIFYHTPEDKHLYRFNKNMKDGRAGLYCYHVKITKDSSITEQCKGKAILNPESRKIEVTQGHTHEPDEDLLKKLTLRKKILSEAASSKMPLNEVFKSATRGEEGAELLAYGELYRYADYLLFPTLLETRK